MTNNVIESLYQIDEGSSLKNQDIFLGSISLTQDVIKTIEIYPTIKFFIYMHLELSKKMATFISLIIYHNYFRKASQKIQRPASAAALSDNYDSVSTLLLSSLLFFDKTICYIKRQTISNDIFVYDFCTSYFPP